MAEQGTVYDLLLLLSSDVEDERRTTILSSVESAITSAGGSIERNDNWGRRPMAYEIRHQPEAEYHLLQFQAPATLIEELSHTLRITDGVLRNRIIKVRPGTPEFKSSPPPVVSAVASSAPAFSGASGDAPRPGSAEPAPPDAEGTDSEDGGSEAVE